MNERDLLYLHNMRDECQHVELFISGRAEDALQSDLLFRYALIHAIQIIGEAASHVSVETRQTHTDIAWEDIIGMRHWLVHGYNRIDLTIVWKTAIQNVPQLAEQLAIILNEA
jgi:uncharacterized protein with HEPN domain